MGRGKKSKKSRNIRQSTRAGINFPVGRIGSYMRAKKYSSRTGAGAPVFLGAVLEYLCAEVLESAGDVCKETGRHRITPRHIELAVRNDDDLGRYLSGANFANAGMAPYINPCILKKRKWSMRVNLIELNLILLFSKKEIKFKLKLGK